MTPHDRMLDGSPTFLEEHPPESIRTQRLIVRHLLYSLSNLLFGDGGVEVLRSMVLHAQFFPIEILVTRACPPHDLGEVVVDDLFFFLVLSHPTLCMLQPVNVVFSPTGIDATVEEFGVCITLPQICQPSTYDIGSFKPAPVVGHIPPGAELEQMLPDAPL